jgi:DNA modification methylase
MIRDEHLPELNRFRAAERQLPFRSDPTFADLVVASDNEHNAVHRWFRLKESFSPRLLSTVLKEIYTPLPVTLSILDPFSGVGTALLSAQALRAEGIDAQAVGIERNPFIAFAARAKLNWPSIDPARILRDGERAVQLASGLHPPIPTLSSIRTGRCISLHKTKQILALRDAIRQVSSGPTADALLLGLAASIESMSKTRKDGRALRIVERKSLQMVPTVMERWREIAQDCSAANKTLNSPTVPLLLEGDGRNPVKLGVRPGSVDLIFTSPPYPNNIDYSEVYKLELWLLGFVTDSVDFLALRRQTFRSHPTCAVALPPADFLEEISNGGLKRILTPILIRASNDQERTRVFRGYFSDMWSTLKNAFVCLREGGHAVFVVGNSLHGSNEAAYLLPTDLVIGKMAQRLGFVVCDTIIARNLRRRLTGNHFLRESIVVLQKPHGRKRQTTV